jgi:hypothetical protein
MDDRQKNEAIQKMLPENPERGSYYWWMKEVLRQYSGAHMLDSGGAYGRIHSAPVPPEESPPLIATFFQGEPEGVRISLGHFLANNLEADTEVAIAFEKLLYWVGEWAAPREEWGKCIKLFTELLPVLNGYVEERGVTYRLYFRRKAFIAEWLDPIYSKLDSYDLMRYQQKMSQDEYIALATKELPVREVKTLHEYGMLEEFKCQGGYTYNEDNDLSQDFVYYSLGDIVESEYVIIRSHNGCDARGGFSSPVVAEVKGDAYWVYWRADFYSPESESQYNSFHEYQNGGHGRYDKEQQRWVYPGHRFPSPTATLAWFHQQSLLDTGQELLPGIEPVECPLENEEDARAVVQDFDRQWSNYDEGVVKPMEAGRYVEFESFEYQWPLALIDTEQGPVMPDREESFVDYSAYDVRYWDSESQSYSVRASSYAEGM